MDVKSISTPGRTLDIAAPVYDFVEPLVMLGKQKEMNDLVVSLIEVNENHRVLDIGCGTGVLTSLISEKLSKEKGGSATGIDAAGKMIAAARIKRGSEKCTFEAMAAENLDFEDNTFDSVVSTLFYHHINLELKQKSLNEAFRVLKPGGRLVIADMHIPTSFFGALTAHTSRWFFMQPEIGENIRGVLPGVIQKAGFKDPEKMKDYLGYISVFLSSKP